MGRPRKNPVDPIERFPQKPRADGRFQKRIRSKLYYFGFNGDRDAALLEYDGVKRALYEGRSPRREADDDVTDLTTLARDFLSDRWTEVQAGRLEGDWYKQHARAVQRFVKFVGGSRVIGDLGPDDFASYGRHLSGKLKLAGNTFNRERSSIVALFNWAADHVRIEHRPVFGKGFRRIPKGTIRRAQPTRLMQPVTLKAYLAAAVPQMRAMIMLGANAGFGAEECAALSWQSIEVPPLDGQRLRIIRDRRAKTAIVREAPLWPETVAALASLRRLRPADDLVFRTKYGNAWNTESIAHAFARTVERANAGRKEPLPAHTFYDLRRLFLTYANEVGDPDAVKRIAGHKLPGMSDTYVQMLLLTRMVKVVDHVRARLGFGQEKNPGRMCGADESETG